MNGGKMINPYKVVKEIGFERLAGSEGEKKAIKILSGYIKELGLKHKLESPYPETPLNSTELITTSSIG